MLKSSYKITYPLSKSLTSHLQSNSLTGYFKGSSKRLASITISPKKGLKAVLVFHKTKRATVIQTKIKSAIEKY